MFTCRVISLGSLATAPGERAVPDIKMALWKSPSEAWVTGELSRRETMLAPVPWPTIVTKDWQVQVTILDPACILQSRIIELKKCVNFDESG